MSVLVGTDGYLLNRHVTGEITVFLYDVRNNRVTRIVHKKNLILYTGADIIAKCLTGDTDFAINMIYFEYKNLSSPGEPISIPSYDRGDPSSYYSALSGTSDTDIIRTFLMSSPAFSTSDSNYNNNRVTFAALTEVAEGQFGKPFTSASNSEVYGAALVAAPSLTDMTQDVVFARTYFTQVAKQPNQQIGIKWTITFV